MKLIFSKQGTIYKCVAQGKIETYSEDPALASVLGRIVKGGSISALGDLGVFGAGLKESFESEKLTLDGKITPKGKEIADTGYNWKGLSGRFVFKILLLDGKHYLLNCEGLDKQDTRNYTDTKEDLDLKDEYRPANKKGYRNIHLDRSKKIGEEGKVTVEISYDFEEKMTTYALPNLGAKFHETGTFRHTDFDEACEALSEICENYGLVTEQNDVVLRRYGKDNVNSLLKTTIDDLLDSNGSLNLEYKKYRVEGVRLIIDRSDVADELLYHYLSHEASKRYLGYSEISSMISKFYGFFRRCKDISNSIEGVYTELLERTSLDNKKAHLRLQAYRDIVNDLTDKAFRLDYYDFTNERASIVDILSKIVGRNANVKSVTMITKFAYTNASISRVLLMMADVLKKQYNGKLKVIAARGGKDQSDVAKELWGKLNDRDILIEKSQDQLKKIHDRYYRIIHTDGSVEWVIMTGELDALRYDNDDHFRNDIEPNTKGSVKEMRIVHVKEECIPENVKTVIGGV